MGGGRRPPAKRTPLFDVVKLKTRYVITVHDKIDAPHKEIAVLPKGTVVECSEEKLDSEGRLRVLEAQRSLESQVRSCTLQVTSRTLQVARHKVQVACSTLARPEPREARVS